jgi:hypothetical protein
MTVRRCQGGAPFFFFFLFTKSRMHRTRQDISVLAL